MLNYHRYVKKHELNPPAPFSCGQKKGGHCFAPLCFAERACPAPAGGWGEFMKKDKKEIDFKIITKHKDI